MNMLEVIIFKRTLYKALFLLLDKLQYQVQH